MHELFPHVTSSEQAGDEESRQKREMKQMKATMLTQLIFSVPNLPLDLIITTLNGYKYICLRTYIQDQRS